MRPAIGIDFGTTNSVVAMLRPDGSSETLRHPTGDLFRSVQKQMDQYQGFWLVSPEGKALAKKHEWVTKDQAKYPQELVETMDEVLRAYASVKPRRLKPSDPLPDRGTGVQKDGGVSLALYGRLMHKGKPDGPMMLDSESFL